MIHGPARHARLTATLAAAVLALITAASACAQPGGGGAASQGGGRAIPSPDSVLARSHRSREKGAASATLTVIEISDFQCPYCRQFYEQTYRAFDSAYVKTGKVRMTFIHFPLSIHSQAYPASKAAACAGAQGKFWEMHDRLFSTQREWSGQADATQRFARFAMDLGLDPAAYRDCVDNDRTAPLIINDVMQAAGAGVTGTPAFVINNRIIPGAVPFADLAREIDAALAAPAAPAPAPAPAPPAPPGS